MRRTPVVHSHCVQVHIKHVCRDAISILSAKSGKGEIPLVLIPTARMTASLMMRVPTGCYCLVQRFGKDIGEMEPGLHLLPSFYRIAYVVSKQACTYDAPVMLCPTSDDVRVSVDTVVVFQINNPSDFIYRLGAKNFDDFLSGTVDEAIRMLVRKEDHKSVYSLWGERADHMLKLLNDKFSSCGVRFSDVKITSVWLPDALATCLEATTKMDKAMDKLRRQNEYELMQIKQESEMTIEEIKRRGEQVLVAEAGRKRRAELEFEQRSVKAEEDGRVALIDMEGKAEVMKIQAQTELQRTKTKLETYRVMELAKSESEANAFRKGADLEVEEAIIEAGWQEEKMINDALSVKHEAGSEQEAGRWLTAKRKHEAELKEKRILGELAKDGHFNLVGTSGDKVVGAMLSGNFKKKM